MKDKIVSISLVAAGCSVLFLFFILGSGSVENLKLWIFLLPILAMGLLFFAIRIILEGDKLAFSDAIAKAIAAGASISGLVVIVISAHWYIHDRNYSDKPVVFVGSGTVYHYLKTTGLFDTKLGKKFIVISGGSGAGAALIDGIYYNPKYTEPKPLFAMMSRKPINNDFQEMHHKQGFAIRLRRSIPILAIIPKGHRKPSPGDIIENCKVPNAYIYDTKGDRAIAKKIGINRCIKKRALRKLWDKPPKNTHIHVGGQYSGTRGTVETYLYGDTKFQYPVRDHIKESSLDCDSEVRNSGKRQVILLGSFFNTAGCNPQFYGVMEENTRQLLERPLILLGTVRDIRNAPDEKKERLKIDKLTCTVIEEVIDHVLQEDLPTLEEKCLSKQRNSILSTCSVPRVANNMAYIYESECKR